MLDKFGQIQNFGFTLILFVYNSFGVRLFMQFLLIQVAIGAVKNLPRFQSLNDYFVKLLWQDMPFDRNSIFIS